MQLFVTTPCPLEAAERLWKVPIRAQKMITESQQILACAQDHFLGKVTIHKVSGELYKTPLSRRNHPVVKWVCRSTVNASWVLQHLHRLRDLYTGAKFINVWDNINELYTYSVFTEELSDIKFLNFAKADSKGLDFTNIEDVFEAYDRFLKAQNA
jgi:hypothetical protein